ncbi:MAG: glycosyltransferase [Mycobacteriales bacterium]
MSGASAPGLGLAALHQRLAEVLPELLPDGASEETGAEPTGADCAELLRQVVAALVEQPSGDRVWLLLVALSATFPVDDDVRAARRQLELASLSECCVWLLEWSYAVAVDRGSGVHRLQLVRSGVVVDVDFTAKHDLQTGVQRVVRRLVPRWERDHDLELGVWSSHAGALRTLQPDERHRVLSWAGPLGRPGVPPVAQTVLVPWRSTLVLPEVPGTEQCLRLASLAQHSGNRVVAVGHDCIPVVSADLLPTAESNKFVRFLSLVKHASVIAGVSRSAAGEFRGFAAALPTQGLPGPRVVACPLAFDDPAPQPDDDPRDPTAVREVLVVGSHEPRKNHLAVLHAAEVLWREGLDFSLRFVGGSGWTTSVFDARFAELVLAGRPVTAERGLDDEQLWAGFRRARFSVFPSLHEGFGLPVAESLALGTPVVGTAYGSIGEVGVGGGVVLVDPRDDDDLAAALRRLLTDDAQLARLRQETLDRPVRSWDDYARELWQHLVVDQ